MNLPAAPLGPLAAIDYRIEGGGRRDYSSQIPRAKSLRWSQFVIAAVIKQDLETYSIFTVLLVDVTPSCSSSIQIWVIRCHNVGSPLYQKRDTVSRTDNPQPHTNAVAERILQLGRPGSTSQSESDTDGCHLELSSPCPGINPMHPMHGSWSQRTCAWL